MSEEAGTTRDAVDSVVSGPTGRSASSTPPACAAASACSGVEYYSFLRATRRSSAAHVAVLVIDAADGFTVEDKKIAARVIEAGRALLLVANKWDLVEDKDRHVQATCRRRRSRSRARTVLRTSATRGQGVQRLPPILADLHDGGRSRATTSTVNEIVQRRAARAPDAADAGNLHYATQVSIGTADVRAVRRRERARPGVPALPGEPAATRASPRRRPVRLGSGRGARADPGRVAPLSDTTAALRLTD